MALTAGTYGLVTTAPTTTSTGRDDYSVLATNVIQSDGVYTSPAYAITITEMGFYTHTWYPSLNFYAAVYDSDGDPDNLLGNSGLTATNVGSQKWNRATMDVEIPASTDCWLAIYSKSTSIRIDSDWGGSTNHFRTGVSSLPDPFGTPSTSGHHLIIYALYEKAVPATPTGLSATDGTHTDKVVVTWNAVTGYDVTGYDLYYDGSWHDVGNVTSYNHTAASAGTITPGTVAASDGTSTAHIALTSAGYSVANGATETYKVRAYNSAGDSAESSTTTGYRGTGALTRTWYRSAGDSDASYSSIGQSAASYNDTGAPAPTVTPGNASATDGTGGNGVLDLSLSGASANNGAGRYYKAYYTATGCTAQWSTSNRGYRGVGSLTYLWYMSAGDSDASYSSTGQTTAAVSNYNGAPDAVLTLGTTVATDGSQTAHVALSLSGTSLAQAAGRYFKCLVSATGASSQYSTANRGYNGVGTLTYQWYRSSGDADSGYSSIGGATSSTYNDTAAPAGVITPGTAAASDGTDTAEVNLSLSGQSVADGAGRYWKCLLTATGATNSGGYSTANRGYRGTGALTYQWYRSAGDSDASYSVLSGVTSATDTDPTATAGVVTGGTADASDGTSPTEVTLSLSGESVADGVAKYYKCYLSATGTTSQYSTANRGYRGTGALTYQWQRSAADSDASYSNIIGATTDPYSDTEAPASGEGRYYQCVLSATGTAGAISSTDRGYRISGDGIFFSMNF